MAFSLIVSPAMSNYPLRYRNTYVSNVDGKYLTRWGDTGPLGDVYYILDDLDFDLKSTVGDFEFTRKFSHKRNLIYDNVDYVMEYGVWWNPTAKLWLNDGCISDVFNMGSVYFFHSHMEYWTGSLVGTYQYKGPSSQSDIVVEWKMFDNGGWAWVEGFGIYGPIGRYEAFGSKVGEPDKYVGRKMYASSTEAQIWVNTYEILNGEFVYKQVKSVNNGMYSYTAWNPDQRIEYMWYDGTNWILSREKGVADSDIGYWKSPASLLVDTYDLVYTGPLPEPTPSTVRVRDSSRYWDAEYTPVDRVLGKTYVSR